MKKLLLLSAFFLSGYMTTKAQNILSAQKVNVSFYSSAPIEDIQARTEQGSSTLDTTTGVVYFKIPVHSFQFENSLMQRHFNSDYLETKKYPNALFKGDIKDMVPFAKDGKYNVTVAGKLTIHGVTRDYSGAAMLTIKGGRIDANTSFKVRLKDYNIEIPSLLTMNIAEVVEVKVSAEY